MDNAAPAAAGGIEGEAMEQKEEPDNLVEFLENSVAKYPDRPLFGTKTPRAFTNG